ncbi:MAG TPA: hypothetical protein VGN42_25680 [Pirellulales bacterium]|nr:hypothetical protein [Pirellulales bacterium]
MTKSTSFLAICLAALASNSLQAAELDGWQGMRVIGQSGMPTRMLAADLDGQGRDQLIVVNTRESRLDLYRWLAADQLEAPVARDENEPNELPLAPDWKKSELVLEELPLDLAVQDLDGDGKPELIVLTSPSNKVVSYQREAADKWQKSTSWDLLAGAPAGRNPLLLRPLGEGKFELLVSCEQGIQTLRLEPGNRPSWLSPRENHGRVDWKLVDIDGDGDQDVLEWSQQARQTVRWYETSEGKLLPAQVLFDQSVQAVEVLRLASKPAELLLLGGPQQGLLRRYGLARGAETELGRRETLPMPGGAAALWCGLLVDGRAALVAVDPSQPRLRVQPLGEKGWLAEQSFPTLGNLKGLAAVQAKPGTLLLWTKDGSDLHESRWEAGRLTYPKAMPQSAEVNERRILALDRVGDTIWWAQRVGANVDVYVWAPGQQEPVKTRYEGVGAKIEKVVWLGEVLLVQDQFAGKAKLVRLTDGKTQISEPSYLVKADLGEYRLLQHGQELRPTRLSDGVLQWLGDDLQPLDQIMLSEGQRLAAFAPLADGSAWALEQGGVFLHRLKPDNAGILRETESTRLPGGVAITLDPLLGLMLVDQDRVIRLSRGQPWELKLIDSLDSRVGRPSGVKEATIHRIMTTDLTGDHVDEAILCDDHRHQLTVLERTEDKLKSVLSWPVFEDKTYPYGGVQGSLVTEPRMVIGLNADGDDRRDAALLCHDRLLIYMASEKTAENAAEKAAEKATEKQ